LGDDWPNALYEAGVEGRELTAPETTQKFKVKVFKEYRSDANPFYNPETFGRSLALADFMGKGDAMRRRLISTQNDDPSLVFPKSRGPHYMTPEETKAAWDSYRSGFGWDYMVGIDPGWGTTGVVFALIHPVKGIFFVNELYLKHHTALQSANKILELEVTQFGKKPYLRVFDNHFFSRTSYETGNPLCQDFVKVGCHGIDAPFTSERVYDRIFEMIDANMWQIDPMGCPNFVKEIKKHKYDVNMVPKDENDHCIDSSRFLTNAYYERYFKKLMKEKETKTQFQIQQEYIAAFYKNKIAQDKNNRGYKAASITSFLKP
jgi:hypothetical protein